MALTPAQLIRRIQNNRRLQRKKGFTLVEVIIASSIFTIVSLIGVTVFVNVTRIQKRISLENAMYEDGRFMMERLAREIRENTVDYEEYYNMLVEKTATPGLHYGEEYGCYSTRFYNPGSPVGSNGLQPGGLGALCSSPTPGVDPALALNAGCVIDKRTLDINTGSNPFGGNKFTSSGNPPESANAFCDKHFASGSNCGTDITLYGQNDLYLIDSKGKQKTIFALKKIDTVPEYALGMLRIQGIDKNSNDIVDTWYDATLAFSPAVFNCAPGFECPDPPAITSLEDTKIGTTPSTAYVGFVPMSPSRTNVKSLKFYVSPLEDPRKAFAETDAAQGIQQQPHVTIVMTLEPAASELAAFGGSVPTITIQNTVTSRVYNEVRSYEGTGNCNSY